ncbi:MAG TPA: recombinase family protein [Trebonia sp.]|nr:recombinase family protein [Trebonia sp.]
MVRRIFAEYLAGRGLKAIAEDLTRDDIPSPSAYDPGRNKHRCGIAWSYGAVRAILGNPRYTGRQVWNKLPKSELLIDVNDVALGHATKQKWNEPGKWIWSKEPVHEPLVGIEAFERVRALQRAKGSAGERSPRLMMIIRATQEPGTGSALRRAPECMADAGPLQVRAAEAFAAELAAGRVPSVRVIRARLHMGQSRAQRVRAYLAALSAGGRPTASPHAR